VTSHFCSLMGTGFEVKINSDTPVSMIKKNFI
jgi:hypothetical protein